MVDKFLKACKQQESVTISWKRIKKNFAIWDYIIDKITNDLKLVTNLSQRILTATEISALNIGLQFGIFPSKFDFLLTQATVALKDYTENPDLTLNVAYALS